MSELIDREALKDAVKRYAGEPIKAKDKKCQAICLDMLGTIDAQPTASPWHRVEKPPKEVGCYLVVGFDRHWFYDIAEYFPIDNEWAMSENQPDSTYIRYWMHMPEPPKGDA